MNDFEVYEKLGALKTQLEYIITICDVYISDIEKCTGIKYNKIDVLNICKDIKEKAKRGLE